MAKKASWSSGKLAALGPEPVVPTQWEQKCADLGISENDLEAQRNNTELREWVEQKYLHRYVPTETLLAFGLSTDAFAA